MSVEPVHFKILLALLIVAYKGWEFLRNSARKKSDAAQNVPVPADIEQLPWEDQTEPVPERVEPPRPQVFSQSEAPVPLPTIQPVPEPDQVAPLLTDTFRPSTRTAPIRSAGNQALPTPNLRDLVLGQVVLGKPVSLAPRGSTSSVRR